MNETNKITDAEIMQNVLSKLRYSANEFSKVIEYKSHASVYHVLTGLNHISNNMRNRIVQHFPEVKFDYLLKGEGSILKNNKFGQTQINFSDNQKVSHESFDNISILLRETNEKLGKIIHLLEKQKN